MKKILGRFMVLVLAMTMTLLTINCSNSKNNKKNNNNTEQHSLQDLDTENPDTENPDTENPDTEKTASQLIEELKVDEGVLGAVKNLLNTAGNDIKENHFVITDATKSKNPINALKDALVTIKNKVATKKSSPDDDSTKLKGKIALFRDYFTMDAPFQKEVDMNTPNAKLTANDLNEMRATILDVMDQYAIQKEEFDSNQQVSDLVSSISLKPHLTQT